MIDIDALKRDKRPQSSTLVHALIDRLEAAEKERDKLKELNIALCTKSNSQVIHNARLAEENDTLRAKIEAMEQQKPVEWQARTRPAWNDGTWGPWRKCSEEYAEDIKNTPLLHDWLYEARTLYTLPGAKTQGEEK